jgi:hypothetical protein
MPLTPMKPVARNISNLGGVIFIDCFTEAQFVANTFDFPTEAQSSTGEVLQAAFTAALSTAVAVRLTADIETFKVNSAGAGDASSTSYSHGFEGEFAGDTLVQQLAIRNLDNQPVVCVAVFPNGDRKLFGTFQKPITILFDFDSMSEGAGKKRYKAVGKQNGSCSINAPKVATAVTYTVTA